jgi:hypothetical protein
MPVYCYKTASGQIVDQVFPMGRAPRFIMHHKAKAWRCYHSERASVPATKGWPMECLGSGVNAAQAGELRDHLARAGVPTEVSRDGNPIYRNKEHRRRALKARGLVDKQSYL